MCILIRAEKDYSIIGYDVHINAEPVEVKGGEDYKSNIQVVTRDKDGNLISTKPIDEAGNEKLMAGLIPHTSIMAKSPLSSKVNLSRPAESMEMFAHYRLGKGENLTLDNLGASKLVSNAIIKDGAFGKHGSIQSRFTRDIAKKFLKGNNDYSFLNGYDVGSEIGIWAFGSGDIGGKFVGSITQLKSGDISVIGTIDYRFSDIFKNLPTNIGFKL